MTTRKRRTKIEMLQHLEAKRDALEFQIAHERSEHVRDLTRLQGVLFNLSKSSPETSEQERFVDWHAEVTCFLDFAVTAAISHKSAQ